MRILLINWQDPENPRSGGAEIHLLEIFRRVQQAGHSVIWLTSGWKGAPGRTRIAGMDVLRTGSRYTFGAAAPRYYRRELSSQPFDIVIEALNKVPLYSPLWVEAPVVLLVHHLFGSTAFRQAPFPLAAATWLQERPLKRVYRRCDVHAISGSTADDLADRGLDREKMRVVYPGVDLDFFAPSPLPTRAADPTFLYVGRLQRYKRIDLAIRAFARLVPSAPAARFVIAGRGDQERSLRLLATGLGVGKEVHFAGFVSEPAKRDLFRAAWANIFMSPREGWGITNIEAAACATPTIAANSPGLRESVIDGQTGLLVPYDDVSAVTAAMSTLANDPALVERLGNAALLFARGLSWDRAAAMTLDQLLDVAGSR